MDTIDCPDLQLEESFSFSYYDLDSTFEIFSDDEDDAIDNESFIEIALHSTPEPQQFDFRISFDNLQRSSPTRISNISSAELPSSQKIKQGGRIKFPTIERTLNILWSLSPSSEAGEDNGRAQQNPQLFVNSENRELVRTRKASKITTAINGRIMKFFIKFRSKKIRATLISVLKPYQFIFRQSNSKIKNRGSGESTSGLMKPFEKWLVQREKKKNTSVEKKDKSRVMESVTVNAVRGVSESLNNLSIGRKDKESKSCPSSIKSSPTHKGTLNENTSCTRDNSVHAAIVHCKRSLGGNI